MARIYLSSTYTDLVKHREAVYRILRQMRHDVVAMEDYVAADNRPVDKCLKDVAECGIYVGIFAWRYGFVPPGHSRSITELELEEARALDKNIANRQELFRRYEKRLSGQERQEKAHIERGLDYSKKGEWREAIDAYDQALSINPTNSNVYNWKGYSLYRDGAYKQAITSLQQATRLEPGHAEAHYNLGLALWKDGQLDAAADEVAKAFDLDPVYESLAKQDPQSKAVRTHLADRRPRPPSP